MQKNNPCLATFASSLYLPENLDEIMEEEEALSRASRNSYLNKLAATFIQENRGGRVRNDPLCQIVTYYLTIGQGNRVKPELLKEKL